MNTIISTVPTETHHGWPSRGNLYPVNKPPLVRSVSFTNIPPQYRNPAYNRDARVCGLMARANQRRLYHIVRYSPKVTPTVSATSFHPSTPTAITTNQFPMVSNSKSRPLRRHNSDVAYRGADIRYKPIFDGNQFHATLLTRSSQEGITFGLIKTSRQQQTSRSVCSSSKSISHNLSSGESGIDELCSCEFNPDQCSTFQSLPVPGPTVAVVAGGGDQPSSSPPISTVSSKKSTTSMAKDDVGSVRCVRINGEDCVLKKSSVYIRPNKDIIITTNSISSSSHGSSSPIDNVDDKNSRTVQLSLHSLPNFCRRISEPKFNHVQTSSTITPSSPKPPPPPPTTTTVSPKLISPSIVKELMRSTLVPNLKSTSAKISIKSDHKERTNGQISPSSPSSIHSISSISTSNHVIKSPPTNGQPNGQAKSSSISTSSSCESSSDAENSSGRHISMVEKRPSKPPRRQHSNESTNCEQQMDNLVEEIYLSPESGPLVSGEKVPQDSIKTAKIQQQQKQISEHHDVRSVAYSVVVAIDFGTTYSGYAFSFTRDPDSIHMMRKWDDGGDPDTHSHKSPTILLLKPDKSFHSFGNAAREAYHALSPEEAADWLYFEKFKMTLHTESSLSRVTEISSVGGKKVSALLVFSHSLRYFKNHALNELTNECGTKVADEDIRWVVTVPAIWRQTAKQFMRMAAYEAGLGSHVNPNQVLISPEPEAAAIYCRRLKVDQLVPECISRNGRPSPDSDKESGKSTPDQAICLEKGTKYMVVDCGGGTVDITVHEIYDSCSLKELHRASGCPYGSIGVDQEFEKILEDIFGAKFMQDFRCKMPLGYVDLMAAFEARKRSANSQSTTPYNISLPFSFIQSARKWKGSSVESLIKKHNNPDVSFVPHLGILRIQPPLMRKFFESICEKIVTHVNSLLLSINCSGLRYLFMVGGFAESQLLQNYIRMAFSNRLRVVIPRGVSSAVLRGAVLFGLDPGVISIRRSRMTYGIGILNRFVHGYHPPSKLVVRDGIEWCSDIFDKFVLTDQSIAAGDVVTRSYTPAKVGQRLIVLNIYCCEKDSPRFITDEGVKRCGTLRLDLGPDDSKESNVSNKGEENASDDRNASPNESKVVTSQDVKSHENGENKSMIKNNKDILSSDHGEEMIREIQTCMTFSETEIKVHAIDVTSGLNVRAEVDFLSL
ncbi:heat shock 70 kDa protein 12A-like isoform X2 [Brevipalpus obovatus]